MTYCIPLDIYDLTNITEAEVDFVKMNALILHAASQLNSDINLIVEDELISSIDAEKENSIDNSNKTFYTAKYPYGDYTNTGTVTTSDIVVYSIDSDGVRNSYAVSAVDNPSIGKFTLSTAPSTAEQLYCTYANSPIDEDTPHMLIKRACIYLATAFAHTKLGTDKYKTLRLGRLSAMKFDSEYSKYVELYEDTIAKIPRTMGGIVERTASI